MAGHPANRDGRGERVVPGVWRLRLPLPLAGRAALQRLGARRGRRDRAGRLRHGRAGLDAAPRARPRAGRPRVEHVRLLVCTHAHIDHCGQAYALQERTGCELWIHPRHEHLSSRWATPTRRWPAASRWRARAGSRTPRCGAGRRGARRHRAGCRARCGPARDLLPGVRWTPTSARGTCYETPGHAPSHVVLHQPQHRLLLSGDHVLGRISLYFDHGWTPDPVGEFLASLDACRRARRAPVARRPRAPVH